MMSTEVLDSERILAEVQTLVRERLDFTEPLKPEMRLSEDLELDSIRMLTLAVEVEDHFKICLDQEDEWGIETVEDLVATVGRKLAT